MYHTFLVRQKSSILWKFVHVLEIILWLYVHNFSIKNISSEYIGWVKIIQRKKRFAIDVKSLGELIECPKIIRVSCEVKNGMSRQGFAHLFYPFFIQKIFYLNWTREKFYLRNLYKCENTESVDIKKKPTTLQALKLWWLQHTLWSQLHAWCLSNYALDNRQRVLFCGLLAQQWTSVTHHLIFCFHCF